MSIIDDHVTRRVTRPPGARRTLPGDQLKAQLRYRILAGELGRGDRLPPVRQLAAFLRVNRNTVAQVYRALADEGYLALRGRRGTFVRRSSPLGPRLARLVDSLLAEAAQRGIGAGELQALLTLRSQTRPSRLRLGFVECNMVDLTYFRRRLEAEVRAPVRPILLRDLPSAARGCDLLVTTFFHTEEVQRRVPAREVIGLVALPDLRTLEEVSRLGRRSRILVVSATPEGARSKERSLSALGLRRPRLRSASLRDPDTLRTALQQTDVLLAAPRVLERLRGMLPVPRHVRVIPFASILSEASVALLRERFARNGRPEALRSSQVRGSKLKEDGR